MRVKLLKIDGVIECTIISRSNGFVVEVLVGKSYLRAHINNTGRLTEYLVKGRKAFCLRRSKIGKTNYRLFAISDRELAAIIDM